MERTGRASRRSASGGHSALTRRQFTGEPSTVATPCHSHGLPSLSNLAALTSSTHTALKSEWTETAGRGKNCLVEAPCAPAAAAGGGTANELARARARCRLSIAALITKRDRRDTCSLNKLRYRGFASGVSLDSV